MNILEGLFPIGKPTHLTTPEDCAKQISVGPESYLIEKDGQQYRAEGVALAWISVDPATSLQLKGIPFLPIRYYSHALDSEGCKISFSNTG